MILAGLTLLAALAALTVHIVRQERIALNPFVFFSATFALFYGLDWLYEWWRSGESPILTFTLSTLPFQVTSGSAEAAAFCIAASAVALIVGDVASRFVVRAPPRALRQAPYFQLAFLAAAVVGAATLMMALVVASRGGLSAVIARLGERALLYQGASLPLAVVELSVLFGSFAFGVLHARTSLDWIRPRLPRRALEVSLIGLIVGLGLLTGGRFALVRIVVMAYAGRAATLHHWTISPKLVALGVVLLLAGNAFVLAARTPEERGDLLGNVFDTTEVSQSNNLMLLAEARLGGTSQGATVLNGMLGFVPRALLGLFGAEKGAGGSEVFTKALFPDRWERTHSEVAVGVLGDLALSFGLGWTPVACLGLGFLLGLLERKMARGGSLARTALRAGLCLAAVQLVRGSVYQTVVGLTLLAAAVALVALASRGLASLRSAPTPQQEP